MKKLFFAVILTAITMTNMNAQKFGAKLGLNLASFSGDVEDTSMLIGFQIGGVAEFEITEQFTFQPELVFSLQGVKEKNDTIDLGILSSLDDDKIKLSYINIPMMAKYYITDGFNVQFGPQIGFLMSANYYDAYTGDTEDIKDGFKGFDYGLDFGVGYKMDFGLFIDARYNLGLSDVDDADNFSIKNSVINISVGYYFN